MSALAGTCPYCLKIMKPLTIEENIIRRNKYKCSKCFQEITECASWGCYNYVKIEPAHRYCEACLSADTSAYNSGDNVFPDVSNDYTSTDNSSDCSSDGGCASGD